jgi:hypothetical protein
MAGAEGVPIGTQLVHVDGQHADTQHGGDALGGRPGAFETVVQAGADGPQVVAELPAERGEAAGARAASEPNMRQATAFRDGGDGPGLVGQEVMGRHGLGPLTSATSYR